MIPADEHDMDVAWNGPAGHRHATLRCWTCVPVQTVKAWAEPPPTIFYDYTLNLAVKAHAQHVAATDLARQEDAT